MENGKSKNPAGFFLALLVLIVFVILVFMIVDMAYQPVDKTGKLEAPIKQPLRKADSSGASTVTFKELLRATVDTLGASGLEDFRLSHRLDTLLTGVRIVPAREIAAEGWRLRVILSCRQGFDLHFTVTLNTTEAAGEFRKKIAKSISQVMLKAGPVLRQRAAFNSPSALAQFAKSAHDLRPYAADWEAFQQWVRAFIPPRLNEATGENAVVSFSLRPQELMEFHRNLNLIYRGLGDVVVHRFLVALCRMPAASPRLQKERWQLAKAADYLGSGRAQKPPDYRVLFQLWGRFLAAKLGAAKSFEATNASFRAEKFFEKPKILAAQNPVTVAPGFSIDAIYNIRPALNWQQAANAYFSANPFWTATTEKLGVTLRCNPNRGARVKLFFRENDDAISLSQLLRASEDNVIAAVTGTYTSPETTVVGLAYHHGELISGLVQEWGGFCLIAKTGRFHVVDWHDLDLTRVAAALQIAAAKDTSSAAAPRALKIFSRPEDYAAFIGFIEKHRLSVVQGHLLLHRRQIAVNPGGELFSRRLLTQFENGDFGIIDLQGTDLDKRRKTFTLAEAAGIAQALNASEAMNLDMGTWNWGVLKMGPQQIELGAPMKTVENRLTNALILYTEKESPKE